ncbi:AARSD1 [Mytilus edulis]|uniref:AARSD1 n=1 Tax=Mytilus edulis TaxID=6550 RepID=A0A8S3RIU6_MYTED|nr:AARSD1 [Mytilus edulis]
MALACQKDSYLRKYTTKVKSCDPSEVSILNQKNKKEKIKGYEVVLEDTILFPEGGGQPDDRGTINDIPVLKISRRGADAVHFVSTEIPAGTDVNLEVDWARRFDHMQQHTGQHLITTVAESMFGFPTTSWNLGEKISSIELDTPKITEEQITVLEDAVNERIRDRIPVTPVLYHDKDDPKLAEARCRGLPDDHEGPVRVLSIEGLDNTLCCGTHVSNLAHLQLIKLLGLEKGKKNKSNLLFVAGERVRQYLGRSYQAVLSLLRDLALLEAYKFKTNPDKETVLVLHRKEGDNEFMNKIVNEINDKSVTCLLTVGDEKGAGLFLLSGEDSVIQELGPKVAELLEGKGSCSRGPYQGKCNKLSHKTKAEKLVREYIAGIKSEL